MSLGPDFQIDSTTTTTTELSVDTSGTLDARILVSSVATLLTTVVTNLTSTLPTTTTTPSPNTSTTTKPNVNDHEPAELMWIKIALLGAILICLIILICSLCITSFCYFSSLNAQNNFIDVADPRGLLSSGASQPATTAGSKQCAPGPAGGGVVPNSQPTGQPLTDPNTLAAFKRLSVTQDTPRAPLASSLQSPNTSSFSINLAPPSPGSVSIGIGMDSPEETVVKKMALDRMEQEEAKRHMDLALMAEKSTSMSPVKDQIDQEINSGPSSNVLTRKLERKQSDPTPKSSQKKKKRGLAKGSKGGKSKNSELNSQNPVTTHKNPSFTLDNKTNKLVLSSSLKNSDLRNSSPDKRPSV